VRRLAVLERRFGVPIDLNQHEARGIVGLFKNIESHDAGLLNAVPGIFASGLAKCLEVFRFDVEIHDENDHK
jgi:hypothetical protein